MNFIRITLLVFILFLENSFAQNIPIGSWKNHLPYNSAIDLTVIENVIYTATTSGFYTYNKSDNSIERFSKINGLNDIGVSTINYDPVTKILFVAYANSNIDLIKENEIVTISDIKRKLISGDKTIYHIFFKDNLAYLSCGFGIVVVNLLKEEIKDTYYIGPNGAELKINAITSDANKIYAATEKGIFEASLLSPNLADFNEWRQHNGSDNISTNITTGIMFFNNQIIATMRDSIFYHDDTKWNLLWNDTSWNNRRMNISNNKLIITQNHQTENSSKILLINNVLQIDSILSPGIVLASQTYLDYDNSVWVADQWGGLKHYANGKIMLYTPNGPLGANSRRIIAKNNQIWVAPGGLNESWQFSGSKEGFFNYADNYYWNNTDLYSYPSLDSVPDINVVAIHPENNKVFFGSYGGGVVEYNGNSINIFKQNSSLQDPIGFEGFYAVSGLGFDQENNLWVSNSGAERPISVFSPDGIWKSFALPSNIVVNEKLLGDILVDQNNQKWILTGRGQGIVVFDHGENIVNTNDDKFLKLTNVEGLGNLPTNQVLSIAEDLDGAIWVGTDDGVAVFYCGANVFSQNGCDAERILVNFDGFVQYLFEGESVNTIAIDAANRKWVGTNSGVWLLSADGTKQELQFNQDNSPLFSNVVRTIAINHKNGEVFFGTDKGIISYRGTATEGRTKHDSVSIYPNPVKENYFGPIAIKGLVNNAQVKITDVAGMLIYQTRALGGQAIWNGNNLSGKRAKTGVYYVFSSDDNGTETFVGKLLMVN